MKDFPCHLGKIKLVNEKKAFLYGSGYPWGPHIVCSQNYHFKKKKKQQLHQLVAPFAKSGEKLIVIEGNIRTYVTPETALFSTIA